MIALTDGVVTVAFTLIRPLGLTLLFPLLNTRSLGTALIRNSVLLALMVPVLPLVYEQAAQLRGWGWLQQLPGELLIGVILGFCASIPFWAVDMAGFLIDTLRGATMGSVYNPAMAMQTSLFGLLFSQFLCALFFLGGGINLLLSALYDSYRAFPPGTTLALDHRLFDFILMQWQLLYRLCLSFSLPAVLSMILADLALGLINRSARQLNVFFLSMPIKSALALLLLLLSLPYAFHHYLRETETLYPSLSAGWLRHE
ncbi:EscT/YscT/HrcT family type III secretion system export apparatus protein [Sodalis sp.]|uniref:EscT/YscT/HrcT family type III secretion system export apparatus protein n=1 Tax=Sodalis sp. (in: enterobacteria) TaxID=1898979 RepID=UPI00387376B3